MLVGDHRRGERGRQAGSQVTVKEGVGTGEVTRQRELQGTQVIDEGSVSVKDSLIVISFLFIKL